MIRCIIVDDEPLALEVLEHFIARTIQLQLVAKCGNAIDAFKVLHDQQIDLMFIDIKMPGINGLDFVTALKNPPSVIFITAFAEHAIKGFELDAVDYLLKPITFERFEKGVHKVLKMRPVERIDTNDYTYFKVSGRLIKIFHADLLYARSMKDYILINTKSSNHLVYMTMKYMTELLPSLTFLRVHRSYLINRSAIDQLDKYNIYIGEEIIPIGENYRANLEKIK